MSNMYHRRFYEKIESKEKKLHVSLEKYGEKSSHKPGAHVHRPG